MHSFHHSTYLSNDLVGGNYWNAFETYGNGNKSFLLFIRGFLKKNKVKKFKPREWIFLQYRKRHFVMKMKGYPYHFPPKEFHFTFLIFLSYLNFFLLAKINIYIYKEVPGVLITMLDSIKMVPQLDNISLIGNQTMGR